MCIRDRCTFKAFETDAPFITYKADDGRCICKDETAVLTASAEGSSAYSNQCASALLSSEESVFNPSYINVYPNPTKDKLTIEFSESLQNTNTEVSIYSTEGKLVKSENLQSSLSQIDVSSLSTGIYFATFNLNGIHRNIRFVKE